MIQQAHTHTHTGVFRHMIHSHLIFQQQHHLRIGSSLQEGVKEGVKGGVKEGVKTTQLQQYTHSQTIRRFTLEPPNLS